MKRPKSNFMKWFDSFQKNWSWLYYIIIVIIVIILSYLILCLIPVKEKGNGLWLPFIGVFGTLGTLMGFLLTLIQLNKLRSEEDIISETKKTVELENAILGYKQKIKNSQDEIKKILSSIDVQTEFGKQFLDDCSKTLSSVYQDIYYVYSEKQVFNQLSFDCSECLKIIHNLRDEILNDKDSKTDEDLPSRSDYYQKFNEIWQKITDLYIRIK